MSAIGSDDEAPESVSFGSSKQRARDDENALQVFRTQEKRKKKEKNRDRDRKLQERAAQSGKLGKTRSKEEQPAGSDGDEEEEDAAGPSQSDLEARMARAMREADEESASGSESESDVGLLRSGGAIEKESSGDSSQDKPQDEGSDSEVSHHSESEEGDEQPKSSKYLPDHIFTSAFSGPPTLPKSTSKRKQLGEDGPRKAKKRRTKKPSKDVVVGSRTIRTLSTSHDPHAAASLPAAELQQPKTVSKFLKRTLNLSGSGSVAKKRGWERRPAHLGVMKRLGPAANFVRGS